jgi:hypothetical protein
MAAILITVSNNLYTIQLDANDWTGLIVNGAGVAPQPDGSYLFAQTSPGEIDFTASSNYGETLNPPSTCYLTGNSGKTHVAVLGWSVPGSPFQMFGLLRNVSWNCASQAGPFSFSQGGLTGSFQHG